jgi:hypothetical protein
MEQKWIIHQLERQADNGFVFNVHWRYSITETENGQTYYADTYSVASYSQDPESENYIPYEDLTEEIVVGWVKDSLGEERLLEIETSLTQQIENQKNPPVLQGIPWIEQPSYPQVEEEV